MEVPSSPAKKSKYDPIKFSSGVGDPFFTGLMGVHNSCVMFRDELMHGKPLSSRLAENLEENLVDIFGGPPKCLFQVDGFAETADNALTTGNAPTTELQASESPEAGPMTSPTRPTITWTEILRERYSLSKFQLQPNFTFYHKINGWVVELSRNQHLMISLGTIQFMVSDRIPECKKELEMLHQTRTHFLRYQDMVRNTYEVLDHTLEILDVKLLQNRIYDPGYTSEMCTSSDEGTVLSDA